MKQNLQSPNLHVLVVAGSSIFVVGGNVDLGASRNGDVRVPGGVARSDLGAFGVQRNGNLTAFLGFLSSAGIVNDRLVVLVGAVRKVHADDIETRQTELVDSLDGVRLGANCADDGSTAVVLGGLKLGIELGEPLDLGRPRREMVHCSRHVWRKSSWSGGRRRSFETGNRRFAKDAGNAI